MYRLDGRPQSAARDGYRVGGVTQDVAAFNRSAYRLSGVAQTSASSLLTDLVAFWKLDEASGTRADEVGANDLTDNNTVTQAAGKVGDAAQFTAANSESLSIADTADLSMAAAQDFTIAAWVYPDAAAAYGVIVAKSTGTVSSNYEYLLYRNTNGTLVTIVANGTTSGSFTTTGTAPDSEWTFVVFEHNTTDDLIRVYLNNGAAESTAWSGGSQDSAGACALGAEPAAAAGYFSGRLDAVGIWKRVLTAAERTALYNNGNGREHPFS